MEALFRCGRERLALRLPDDARLYESHYPAPAGSPWELVGDALARPFNGPLLNEALRRRRRGPVVVVVSDITRPIPYHAFLAPLLASVEVAGVPPGDIVVLVATGMHRPTNAAEHEAMFGRDVTERYRILCHDPDGPEGLVALTGRSRSGNSVRLNRLYVDAGFRIVTGLVEPHFMAGFSGGRKSVCPGLASLDTVRRFHGWEFLDHERARNAGLAGNPCHEEALSVARLAAPDFSLDVVLNRDREVVRAFAGEFESAHEAACTFVRECACPVVDQEADLVLTSSGGYPLDATFYQCVKGMVSCLPVVRRGGNVVCFGGCTEGIGSLEYAALMRDYAGRWPEFLEDIRQPGFFVKDQWQFQVHCRALEKVGEGNLRFVTDALTQTQLDQLSVHGLSVSQGVMQEALQTLLDELLQDATSVAVVPEGPYCAPVT